MKTRLIIILMCIWSCSSNSNCPNYGIYESEYIARNYPKKLNFDGFQIQDNNERGEILLYEGRDSWGAFYHVITFNCIKEQCNIISYYNQKSGDQTLQTKFSEVILQEKERDLIRSKINKINCGPKDLDPSYTILDGNYFKLFISQDNRKAYEWQIMSFDDEQAAKDQKEKILDLVGTLMELANFPTGEKVVIQNQTSSKDSVEYDIFLTNGFRVKDIQVAYKNKLIKRNRDGIAKLKIPMSETVGIKDSVKLFITLLDGEKALL